MRAHARVRPPEIKDRGRPTRSSGGRSTRIERLAGRRLQRLGLSATIGNPDELLAWLARGRGGHVVGPARPPSDGDVTADQVGSLQNAVAVLSRVYRGERRLVFADSRARVEELTDGLRRAGVRTFVSHGSLAVDERRQAEAAFASEPDCVIVATSTLELGIDVGDLDRVVQIDAPPSVAAFLQRMGRSGRRAGARRNCLLLATGDDDLLTVLGITALWRSGFVDPVVRLPGPAHIYAQQVMALVLQEGGLARGDADRWVGDALAEVPATDRTAVVAHMLARGVLTEDQGVLGMGPVGEREFGRRHFIDVVAAFSSPMLLAVRHGRAELGSVHPASLARRRPAARKLVTDWVHATDEAKRQQLADEVQRVALSEVTYVPWGEWFQPTAFRKNVRDVLKFGAPIFWNVKLA